MSNWTSRIIGVRSTNTRQPPSLKSQAWMRSTVSLHSNIPKAAPNPPNAPEIAPTELNLRNSRLQCLFPAHRPYGLFQRRPLALGRLVRAPAAEYHLAQADHLSRDRRRHALELELCPLFVPQSRTPDLPRGPVRSSQRRRSGGRCAGSRHASSSRGNRDGAPSGACTPCDRLEEHLCQPWWVLLPSLTHLPRHPRS